MREARFTPIPSFRITNRSSRGRSSKSVYARFKRLALANASRVGARVASLPDRNSIASEYRNTAIATESTVLVFIGCWNSTRANAGTEFLRIHARNGPPGPASRPPSHQRLSLVPPDAEYQLL